MGRLLREGDNDDDDDDSTKGRVLRVGDSGCARICVTRLLRLSAFIVGSEGIHVVL